MVENNEGSPGGPEPAFDEISPEGPSAGPGQEERTWGMVAHLSALAGFVVPFGNIIGPLIVWLMKKEEMPFVNDQGKESLNFQISMTIYILVSAALTCVFIGIVLLPIAIIANIVLPILAGIRANKGEPYRYPVTIRIIK